MYMYLKATTATILVVWYTSTWCFNNANEGEDLPLQME